MQLHIDLEPQIDFRRRVAAADAPIVERHFVQHDDDIGGGNAERFETLDNAPVEGAFGIKRATGIQGDFHQRIVFVLVGRRVEMLRPVLDVADGPVALGGASAPRAGPGRRLR